MVCVVGKDHTEGLGAIVMGSGVNGINSGGYGLVGMDKGEFLWSIRLTVTVRPHWYWGVMGQDGGLRPTAFLQENWS